MQESSVVFTLKSGFYGFTTDLHTSDKSVVVISHYIALDQRQERQLNMKIKSVKVW